MNHDECYKNLMVRVILDALTDLKSKNIQTRTKAKKFLLSEDAEWYCFAIGFNYSLIKEINYDNPKSSTKTFTKIN